MLRPIPIADCEEIIYFYERVRYKHIETGSVKIVMSVMKKAAELGMCWTSARQIIRFAKRIGMIDETVYK